MRIIEDILDLSSIEAGKMVFLNETFNFRAFLRTLIPMYELQARERGIAFILDIDPLVPEYLFGPKERIQQVLVNLAGNALKFTGQGRIVISAKELDRTGSRSLLELAVSDTGPGIPPDKLNSIFDSFVQIDSSTGKKHAGTGLGLTISKRIVEELGGTIDVESRPGSGSRFVVVLPLDVENTPPGAMEDEPDETREYPKGLNVLVAEDDKINQLSFQTP